MTEDAPSLAHVGQQLARRREHLDLTQDGLASRIGVTARSVSAIERGANAIRRSKRSTWESALQLKSGTISRAYRDGTAIEVAGAEEPTPTEPITPKDRDAERDEMVQKLAADVADLQRRLDELLGKDRGSKSG